MGFYHPATLVKDAQRRGVRFHPIDVQFAGRTVESDGAIRLGLRYVHGLREQTGRAIARLRSLQAGGASARQAEQLAPSPAFARSRQTELRRGRLRSEPAASPEPRPTLLPECGCDDESMMERTDDGWFCNVCSHDWNPEKRPVRRRARAKAENARATRRSTS